MKKKIEVVALLAAIVLTITSCTKNSNNPSGQNGHMDMYLTDTPGNFEAVNIDIQSVEVLTTGDSMWQTIQPVRAGVYNVMDFRNGMDTLLASADIPAGQVTAVKLVLGTDNSVEIGGVNLPISIQSQDSAGLEVSVNANVAAGSTYKLYLDFNVAGSVLTSGSGFTLKPVIRAYSDNTGGSIKGVVMPASAHPVIIGVMGSDTISTYADDKGEYMLNGVQAGTWDLTFLSAEGTSYQSQTKSNISVSDNNATVVDTVTLNAN